MEAKKLYGNLKIQLICCSLIRDVRFLSGVTGRKVLPMGLKEVFAANVQRYRNAAHLSQDDLADKAGISHSYFGQIERAQRNATLEKVEQIAKALKVDPAALLLNDLRRPSAFSRGKSAERNCPEYEYALVQWADDGLSIRPLEAHYNDLTIQILLGLIEQGYRGDKLVKAYQEAYSEIHRFFRQPERVAQAIISEYSFCRRAYAYHSV